MCIGSSLVYLFEAWVDFPDYGLDCKDFVELDSKNSTRVVYWEGNYRSRPPTMVKP